MYNGQDSVLFNNIREVFASELKTMYARLRSGQIFNYQTVKDRFLAHQSVWPMRLWNEDAYVKYLKPFFDNGEDRLAMLQGDKASQRDWWLFGAFKYRDSKYQTGDALSKIISVRGYTDEAHPISNQSITLKAYAHIIGAVDYASGYITTYRMKGNETHTFTNPLQNMWNTEIYIHSADRISDVGDLSPLNIGEGNFAAATKLNRLIVGSSASGYTNTHLTSLIVGNNELLTLLNICNCKVLATNVDLSGCTGIETVLATGSAITGVQLPVGGHLERIELPETVTNLTIRNQANLTTFVMEGYANLSTLRIENTLNVPIETIVNSATNLSRVRLMGMDWTATNESALSSMITKLDGCQGLDNADNTVAKAVVYGRVNVSSISSSLLLHIQENYPNLVVVVNGQPQYVVHFLNYDGSTLYNQIVAEGGNATDPVAGGQILTPTRPDDANGTSYAYSGWSPLPTNVHSNQNVTAQYTPAFTVRYVNDDGTVLQTSKVTNGQSVSYTGSTPTKAQTAQYTYTFKEWTGADDRSTGAINSVTSARTVTATYTSTVRTYTATFYAEDRSTVLQSSTVAYGSTVTYTGTTPTSSSGDEFDGWEPSNMVITGNTSFYPKFASAVQDVEISDDWDTIIAKLQNGVYANSYGVGNYKAVDLGTEGTINMQIVDIDNEEAPLTFVAKELLRNSCAMNSAGNSDASGGFSTADSMLPYLNTTVFGLLPSSIRSAIKPTQKYFVYTDNNRYATKSGLFKLWVPSMRELYGSGDSGFETDGPIYNKVYPSSDSAARQKYRYSDSSTAIWWLRTTHSSTKYRTIYTDGKLDSSVPTSKRYICIGFCLFPDNISDTWSEIFENIDNGTYATKYSVGDTKCLDLGDEGVIVMQIVAFDTDDKADGNGKAPITWIAKNLLVTSRKMNSTSTNVGGYPASELKTYLDETIWGKIQKNVQDRILQVSKTSYDYATQGDTTSSEKLWIPSAREIFGGSSYEQSGPVYSSIYTDANSRKKAQYGKSSFTLWGSRTANSLNDTNFRAVSDNGNMRNNGASASTGVCVGFCTGSGTRRDTITDSWDTIAANVANGTYSTAYSVGDTKVLDLGSEGEILMQIVAFDADTKTAGGTAAITWVAVDLLVTKKAMNSGNINTGSYPASKMKLYLDTDIWAKIPNNVKSHIVSVEKTSRDKTTTADLTSSEKLWIPSGREIFGGGYESDGPVYNSIYTDGNSRKKTRYGQISEETWWLRSANLANASTFRNVDADGGQYANIATTNCGVCIGFCF